MLEESPAVFQSSNSLVNRSIAKRERSPKMGVTHKAVSRPNATSNNAIQVECR